MIQKQFKYIYGPVYSWRLGMSLGIDPVTAKGKICNFDCVYCQLGRTVKFHSARKVFVPTREIMREIESLPAIPIDHYTFSGRGEPTLAKNLGEMIRALRSQGRGKIAVITNAALIDQEDVQEDLASADFVLAKLDAWDENSLKEIDIPACRTGRPAREIQFSRIVSGLKAFKRRFSGKLALQIMFIEHNKSHAKDIAQIAREINPDEIQINTPLRPSAVKPLGREELSEIKKCFQGLPVVSVDEAQRKEVPPFDDHDTIRRHGNFKKEVKRECVHKNADPQPSQEKGKGA